MNTDPRRNIPRLFADPTLTWVGKAQEGYPYPCEPPSWKIDSFIFMPIFKNMFSRIIKYSEVFDVGLDSGGEGTGEVTPTS